MLARTKGSKVGCLFETDGMNRIIFARFDIGERHALKSFPRGEVNVIGGGAGFFQKLNSTKSPGLSALTLSATLFACLWISGQLVVGKTRMASRLPVRFCW